MSISVELIPGPLTSDMTRVAAERSLRSHPAIRKGARYALEQMDGRWVAALVTAEFPPPAGGPADSAEEAPAPKSEGPDDAEPSAGGSDGDGDDSPPKHDKGDKGGIHEVVQMLKEIAGALGIPIGADMGDPMGGDMGGDPMGPGGPPPGPPGPPAGPGGPPDRSEEHIIHQRVTKPGETPPGGTPIGAPAFASVRPDHPWAHLVGRLASFEVSERIGNTSIAKIANELQTLASETPYRVARLQEVIDDEGHRVAVAKISAH